MGEKRPVRHYVALCVIASAAGGVFLARLQAQSNPTSTRQVYDTEVREHYDFRFGKDNISLPGNAEATGGTFIQPGAFPNAKYCAHCHEQAYEEWRQSVHSNSFRAPFYRTSVNLLMHDPKRGISFTRHCDSCHNPIGVLSGALTENANVDRSFDQDGVTCTTCHSIQQVPILSGNGEYVMAVPAVMTGEKGNRIPGQVPYEEIMQHPERHAKAVMRDLYHKATFCSACHKANLPPPLNDYKWIRAFTAYDEWQNSKFSTQNPLTFYPGGLRTCQNCHMMREHAKAEEYGAKKGTFASHRWLAGNTAVPFYYGYKEQLEKTEEFLKSGIYLNVDLFGLEKSGSDKMIGPLGSVPFQLTPGETVQAMVVVQNKNIGHSLIPEVRDLYECWVEFTVKDAAGKQIAHSGYLKPNGLLDPRAHTFTNRPVDTTGDFVDNHKVWTIHSMAYDNTIQSGRSALIRYQFQILPNAKSPLTISARVNYRHLRQSYLNNVLGPDHPAYPVVELASKARTLCIGENAAARDPNDNPDWMRWNNLGIALLDQLQYGEALHAFQQVLRLRPDYVDGYVNVGLTYIEWEKYHEARGSLERALNMNRNYARALYYLALVERRESHTAAEMADLQEVVRQYPQARDPRRELGISYYQQHNYQEARRQFEALQAIDPDDLAAHYNLAVLYRRLGMKKEASEQAALFAMKQIDPGAPTYSLDYLRKHPEMRVESVPWHLHKNLTEDDSMAGDGR